MLSESTLVRALERAGLRAPVRYEEVTGSTQATAGELASAGAPEWTLVAAGHQTHGRGRIGRSWRDAPGRALLFSLVLRPDLPSELGGLLTLLGGVSLALACREVADQPAVCKWPNDLIVGGRKAGGILAESSIVGGRFEYVVLGVGVNLGTPPSAFPDAGAVRSEAGALLEAFVGAFAGRYEPAHPAFAGAIVSAYREVCATLGERVRATTTAGSVIDGEAEDVDERGGLLVRTPSGVELVRFGEVEHLG